MKGWEDSEKRGIGVCMSEEVGEREVMIIDWNDYWLMVVIE